MYKKAKKLCKISKYAFWPTCGVSKLEIGIDVGVGSRVTSRAPL